VWTDLAGAAGLVKDGDLVALGGHTRQAPMALIRELIRQGFAFAYTLYPFKYRLEYLRLEDEARRAGVGMWAAVPTRIRNGILHGNRRSHSYHSANCEYFNCPNCTVQFRSRYEAENQGFKPHWACIGSRQSAE